MSVTFHKYHGAGNDFLIVDNRAGNVHLSREEVRHLCDRHLGFGADGVMALGLCDGYDFSMQYWNSDGSGGMMCGNGGRCIVAFAAYLGFGSFEFLAPDGPHSAQLVSQEGERNIVRLRMKDVTSIVRLDDGSCFMDTGTRHYVRFVDSLDAVEIMKDGPVVRYDSRFAPLGTNVNFVSCPADDPCQAVRVRTYEKGVEAETLACGTGIVASAISSYALSSCGRHLEDGSVEVGVDAAISSLKVSFRPMPDGSFSEIWLTGPAERVGKVIPVEYNF